MSEIFSTIVVGVDDSEPSQAAIRYAVRLAQEHRGTLVLCHSVDWSPVVARLETGIAFDPTPIIDWMKGQGESLLRIAAAGAEASGVRVARALPEGDAPTSLLAAARDAGAGSIVMGTHGRRGLGRAVMGSTTEAVLRASDVPVLTVRSVDRVPGPTERRLGRIVVAIDDSEPSDAAVKLALELPAEDRRHLSFVSVVDIDRVVGRSRYFNPAIRDELFASASRAVDAAVAAARTRGVDAEACVLEGRAADVILHAANDERADVIVVGSHGRRGVRRFFLGSVAESVVRSAPIPVLVVRRS